MYQVVTRDVKQGYNEIELPVGYQLLGVDVSNEQGWVQVQALVNAKALSIQTVTLVVVESLESFTTNYPLQYVGSSSNFHVFKLF